MMSDVIVNKVAESGLITLDLEEYYPKGEIVEFDLKEFLFHGLILKEKDFREAMKAHSWDQYSGKNVAVFCSADAIIPAWAFMLVASNLQPVAADIFFGNKKEMLKHLFLKNIEQINPDIFAGQRVIIKGCGDAFIGEYAYLDITKKLRPVVKSLMYGEACSAVPVYKKSIKPE
jgi:Protein of unknown function (DUF2480)